MTTHVRKLLPLYDNITTSSITINARNISASLRILEDRENQNSSGFGVNCCYNSFKINPPFDSAMALTVLVLLTALFFMGFFSIYIRRFADENAADPSRWRRRRSAEAAEGGEMDTGTTSHLRRTRKEKGVEAVVIGALPVYAYNGGDVEEGVKRKEKKVGDVEERECAICLSEFEEREWVKEIPYCGHVFHVECIDTWLSSHVTCPLCRTAEFFPPVVAKEEKEKEKAVREAEVEVVVEVRHVAGGEEGGLVSGEVESGSGELRIVVDGRDTWHEEERKVGPMSVRRTSSCSWYGERVRLHRSLSF